MQRTIVLNGDFTFLNTITWKRAIRLLMNEKIEVLKYDKKVVNCSNGTSMKIPLVVKLLKVIRMIYKTHVPCSKRNVMIRDNYTCMYCGSHDSLTIDHVIPVCKGGKTTFENCVTACQPCNNDKNDRTLSEAKMYLKRQPYAPTISEFFRIKMKQLGVDKYLKELGVF